jgi:hypothetical protein
MKRLMIAALVLLTAPAHAAMISGTAIFDVENADGVAVASGSFELVRSVLRDFSLTVDGVTFDEFDVRRFGECFCWTDFGLPQLDFAIGYGGPKGSWTLAWAFERDDFGVSIHVGDVRLNGTLRNGIGIPGEYNLRTEVPSPGALPLFALGLLGLAAVRKRQPGRPRRVRPCRAST